MNVEQSLKFSSELLQFIIKSNLGLKIDGVISENLIVPKKVEITLSYFNRPEELGKESSDRRKLELFATNVRGYLDLCCRVLTLEEESSNSIYTFPGFEPFRFSFIRVSALDKILVDFFQGEPMNNEINMSFTVGEIPFTRVYDVTKTIIELDFKSRVV